MEKQTNLRNDGLPVLLRAVVLWLILVWPLCVEASEPFRVKGHVRDESGIPMAGVTVVERGTKNGTTTNAKGYYEISVGSASESELVFTFIGMGEERRRVGGKSIVDVTMKETSGQLDDVVVIGYATVSKSDLTGSVNSFRSDLMEDRQVLSIEDALRGRAAGVTVSSSNGEPGEGLNIRIRGTGSINASNAPLYVVDGIPMEETDINPGDVASLEILKDASATAIYGSRGANGVVIITTKRGEKGRVRINFSLNTSLQTPVNLYEMMDSPEYALYRYRQKPTFYAYDQLPTTQNTSADRFYDRAGNMWEFGKNGNFADWRKYYDPAQTHTDWQRLMLRNAWVHDYRLSVSGGDENTLYAIMGSYFNQNGIMVGSGFEKYSIRANLDRKVARNLRIGFNFNGARSEKNGLDINDNQGVTMNMLSQQPIKPFTADDYESVDGESETVNNNPYYQARHLIRDMLRTSLLGKLYLDWNIARDFRLNVSGSYSYDVRKTMNFSPKDTSRGRNANGIAEIVSQENNSFLNESLLYYTPKEWGRHKFDAMAGFTIQGDGVDKLRSEGRDFEYEDLKAYGIGNAQKPVLSTYASTRSILVSALARVNYTLNRKYLFTFSLRADGSSKFGADNKWAYFPSGAFAWRISEENALKQIKAVSNLKLRLSAGISGNQAIPAYQTMQLTKVNSYPMDGQNSTWGVKSLRPTNPSLKWETSTQFDAGVDFGFFKNRISGTVDLYYKKTRDLLLEETVPSFSGYTTRWSNKGKIDNKGLEITLNAWVVQRRNFKWNVSYNMAFNRSKVRYIGENGIMYIEAGGVTSPVAILQEGKPVGLWYGYRTDGLWLNIDEIRNSQMTYWGTKVNTYLPGEMKYRDMGGDPDIIDVDDRSVIGYAEPKFTGGFQNTFIYRNLSLSINMDFSYGREIYNSTRMRVEEGPFNASSKTLRYHNHGYYPDLFDRDGNLVMKGNEQGAFLRRPRSVAPGDSEYPKDLFVEDGSFLRISEVSLSYSLPRKFMQKIRLSGCKIYFSVRNLCVFTDYSGYDPDVSSIKGTYGDLAPGMDYGAQPRTRSYTLGLNFTF